MHADTTPVGNGCASADTGIAVPDARPAMLTGGVKVRTKKVDQTEPLLIADTEAARLAGLGRSTWHRLRAAGKVPPPVKLGRSCRWRRAEIVAWIEAGCPDAKIWAAMQGRRNRIVG